MGANHRLDLDLRANNIPGRQLGLRWYWQRISSSFPHIKSNHPGTRKFLSNSAADLYAAVSLEGRCHVGRLRLQ